VLAGAGPAPATGRKLNVVLTASKQDHGAGQHDYPAWQKTWHKLLSTAKDVTVTNAWMWPTAAQFEAADVIIFYYWNHVWDEAQFRQLDAYLARGGGVVILHSATIADKEPEKLAERIGLAAHPQRVRYIHAPIDLKFLTPADHPLTAGLPRVLPLIDEPYWPMIGDPARVELIATTEREGATRPMVWTFRPGPGRVFASIAGHYTWTLDDPVFRVLLLRGIAWAAGESPARLQDLATASQ
jgi:type 1 glutamine amidotransferase